MGNKIIGTCHSSMETALRGLKDNGSRRVSGCTVVLVNDLVIAYKQGDCELEMVIPGGTRVSLFLTLPGRSSRSRTRTLSTFFLPDRSVSVMGDFSLQVRDHEEVSARPGRHVTRNGGATVSKRKG